jgi:sugar phosphate isomerase/epimerase
MATRMRVISPVALGGLQGLMKGSFVTIKIGMRIPDDLRALPIQEVATFARETGLTALDLPRLESDAVHACRDQGLGIGSVDGVVSGELISPHDDVRKQAGAALRAQIASMARSGATVLFLCLVPQDSTQAVARSLELFKDSFPAVAVACEAAGVRIAFEGWPGNSPSCNTLGYTPEVWRAMFQAVPSKALGLCYDPSHLVRLGIDYLRVHQEFADRIVHCHGKDTELLPEAQYLYGRLAAAVDEVPEFSEGPWRYCIPGAGSVNWAAVAFRLEQAGYQGCVSIELEDARYYGSVDKERQGIRKAFLHLAQHFA